MKLIKNIAACLLAVCMVAGLAACGDDGHTYGEWKVRTAATLFNDGLEYRTCTDCEKPKEETRVIPALGKSAALKDAFHSYDDNLTATENGVKLGTIVYDEEEGSVTGAAINLAIANGDDDGIFEFGDSEFTIGFTLDFTACKNDDYTVFSMNFVKSMPGETPPRAYVTECIFGVVKTADGYVVAPLTGVNFNDNDRTAVTGSDKKITVTDDDGVLSFGYKLKYDKAQTDDAKKLSSKLMINGEEKITFSIHLNEGNTQMDGIGTLWNASAGTDNVVMTNLVKK